MFTYTTSSLTHPSTTGHTIRLSSRNQTLTTPTPGLAPQHLQANLIVLPSRFAADFRALCQRNPVPCPLLAESASVGDYSRLISYIPGVSGEQIARDLDLRRDVPRYTVYRAGVEIEEPWGGRLDVVEWWDAGDHVAFLIGCSFSFEGALVREGLGVTAAGLTPFSRSIRYVSPTPRDHGKNGSHDEQATKTGSSELRV